MFVYIIVLFLLGNIIGICCLSKPTKIEQEIKLLNWIAPIFFTYCLLAVFIPTEISLNNWLQSKITLWIIKQLLDGGIIIPFGAFLLSKIFGAIVVEEDLDLSPVYSENISKIFFTIAIITNCISFLIYGYHHNNIAETSNLISRIVIWVISAIGIWLPIGSGCKGRKILYEENITRSKLDIPVTVRIKYYSQFASILLVIVVIFVIEFLENEILIHSLKILRYGLGALVVGFTIAVFVHQVRNNPPEKYSDRRLARYILKCKNGCKNQCYYMGIKYQLLYEDGEIKLKVFERTVISEEGQKIDNEAFRSQSFRIGNDAFVEIKEILKEIEKQRNLFLQKAFRDCREEKIRNTLCSKE